jgi:hypothetical protein
MARLAANIDSDPIPKGEAWHRTLLSRMSQSFRGRNAIVSQETLALLDRMRAFRHRERNTYGFHLDTAIVLERGREVIRAYNGLADDVRRFLEARG